MLVKRIINMQIKPSNSLYPYFLEMTHLSKNLYNEANFLFRQVFFGLAKEKGKRQPNEVEAINALNGVVDQLNLIRKKNGTKPFSYLDEEHRFLLKYHMDGFLKLTKQADYMALPAQCNQRTLSMLYDEWKGYFEAVKDYKKNPSKYLGRPRPPKYVKKDGFKVCVFTNQISVIKKDEKGTYLKLPKTKLCYYLGDLDFSDKVLKEVRIVPRNQHINLELVYETEVQEPKEVSIDETRVAAIDLGLENLIAMVDNTGNAPLLFKGKKIKSINHYYNKQKAYYTSILRKGKENNEGPYSSKRLEKLTNKRNNQIKDILHKASTRLIDACIERKINVLVIGHNKNWKQNIELGKVNNQNFVQIPFTMLINMITYKAENVGIKVIIQEESYTSKASALDHDNIPVYRDGSEKRDFSGKRVKRGLYVSSQGIQINADVNGASNIMRKAYKCIPKQKQWRIGVVDAPVCISYC